MKLTPFSLLVILALVFTSCEKFIEVDQPDILEQDQAFGDQNSTRLSTIGIYGLIADLTEPLFLAGELRADLAVANKSAESFIKEYSNNTFSSSNPYVSPKPFYSVINNANDFINVFEDKLADNEIDSSTFREYKAELVAIRVFAQYQMLKIYGKCSYYNESQDMTDLSGLSEINYDDPAAIQLLINDLRYSDTSTYSSINDGIVWMSTSISDFYVNYMMADLYFDLGDYERAYGKYNELTYYGDSLNTIEEYELYNIRRGDFEGPLWFEEFFDEDWENISVFTNSPFMIAFDNKYNQTNELWSWTLSLDYQIAPADSFVNQFMYHAFNTDFESVDYRYLSIINHDETVDRTYSISKYPVNDRPFMLTRTARIELMKAYCQALTGEERSAYRSFNRVRGRIDFVDIDDDMVPEGVNEVKWLEDQIIQELAYETCFEGQRWFDLMRVAKRRNDPSYLADRVAKKYPEDSREELKTYLMNPENWYIPVFE